MADFSQVETVTHCLYAHGFEGQPTGPKAQFIQETLGWTVTAPSMHHYGWTLSDHTQVILDALDADSDISWVIGSSFGAFAAVMALQQRADRHVKAILLAPAMNFADVMSHHLGVDGFMRWQNTKTLMYAHRGVGRWVELPFDLWTQSHQGCDAIVVHPSVVIHGVRDDVISIDVSRKLKERSSGILELIAVDDDHGLNRSLSAIGQAVARLDAYSF